VAAIDIWRRFVWHCSCIECVRTPARLGSSSPISTPITDSVTRISINVKAGGPHAQRMRRDRRGPVRV
jgi:hypothetical protein